jgi:hypothetical protein
MKRTSTRAWQRTAGVALALALPLAILSSAAAGGAGSSSGGRQQSWLYMLDAQAGVVDGDTLTLSGVDPIATGFSDRPQRNVARFELSELIEKWDALGFRDDPPNAGISWLDAGQEHTIVVVLSDPQTTSDGVSFTYEELEKTPKRLRSRTGKPQPDLPAALRDVLVFVDHAFPTSVNGQVTD